MIAKKVKLVITIFLRYDTLKALEKDKSIVSLFKKWINTELKIQNKKVEDIKEVVYNYNTKDLEQFKSFIEEIKKEND